MRPDQAFAAALEHANAGRVEQAERLLRSILQKSPAEPNANTLLAMIHGSRGEDERALFYISRAAAASPDPDTLFMHGNVLYLLRRHAEAAAVLGRALDQAPAHAQALDVYCKCRMTIGESDAAAAAFERAIAVEPHTPALYSSLAWTLCEVARPDDAAAVLHRGLRACPNNRDLVMFAACYLNFVETDPNMHRELHRRLASFDAPAGAGPRVPVDNPDPQRALRVAILSSDLRDHVCGTFLRPLVAHASGAGIELYLYAVVDQPDAWSAWFRERAAWRDVGALDAAALRAQCAHDRIDVLVECNGWTTGMRLAHLAAGAAPVQATYLGYPNTTGMPGIGWRLVDAATDPPGAEAHCTERLARLDGCFLCYMPHEGDPAPADRAPCEASGSVTFGSFNRAAKISARTVALWSRILARVPGSRLMLKSRVQSEALNRDIARRIASDGVDPGRIVFSPYAAAHADHMALYRDLDVALDCVPYNGTTTTCEALAMGVPVITLAGSVHRARVGASLLSAAGMPDLVAADDDAYVDLAASLGTDRARLAQTRARLRAGLPGSTLLDAAGYARRFEAAMRGMWRDACAQR
ncbi:MAG: tetratricopeptide repeat protein [Planctomycetota bacterium]|nr:tetratricopeptide repeat protein [Planctomycetota bacterium]